MSWILLLLIAFLPFSLLAQTGETAIVKQAIQLQQETPADTRIADNFEQLKANPKDPMVHLRLADIYAERELYELAIQSYRMALELRVHFPEAHAGLSQVFRKKKLPALELKEMEAAVQDAPDDPNWRLKLGILYMEPQHFDYGKAKKQYQALKKMESPLAAELGAKMGLD